MIVQDTIENKPIISSAITDTNQFSIKNSAKAFYILSTSLYSDPKLAILRELGCNARDSHKAAGQTRPWRLHLPTAINPMLEIEDYGLGLSHEEVMNLFTTFFESTKTNSNDFVGALGLGSKSPFSYTDNYTVVATKNGIRNFYSAYKTDAGVPAIARLSSQETSEPNGVLIQIAIKTQDFQYFSAAAAKAFRFFDQYPECKQVHFARNVAKWEPAGITDLDVERDLSGITNYSYVVMGGVAYPIDPSKFINYKHILFQRIIFQANIGDVEMTPSREGLTYNAQTVAWIQSKLEHIVDKLSVNSELTLTSMTTEWDKQCFIDSLCRDNLLSNVGNKLKTKYYPNGFSTISIDINDLRAAGVEVRKFVKNSVGKYRPTKIRTYNSSKNSDVINFNPDAGYRANGAPVFFWNNQKLSISDISEASMPVASSLLKLIKNKREFIVFSGKTEEFMKKLETKLMGLKIIPTSDVFVKKEKIKVNASEEYCFYYDKVGNYYSKRNVLNARRMSSFDKAHQAKMDPKYYVVLSNSKIYNSDNSFIGIPVSVIESFIGKNIYNVIGVSKSSKQKKNIESSYINLVEHIKKELNETIEKVKNDPELIEKMTVYFAKNRLNYYTELSNFSYINFPTKYIDELKDKNLANIIKSKIDDSNLEKIVPYFDVVLTKLETLFQPKAQKLISDIKKYSILNIRELSDIGKKKPENFVKILNLISDLV